MLDQRQITILSGIAASPVLADAAWIRCLPIFFADPFFFGNEHGYASGGRCKENPDQAVQRTEDQITIHCRR